jgi:multimeric flavodoxin WrbA
MNTPGKFLRLSMISLMATCCAATLTAGTGQYQEVAYPPSETAGGLKLGVTYTVWVPDGVSVLRGVIVHQHGCGTGACQGGATAAYDLHWQALARKWDCALLGPSYNQTDKDDCRLWSDPRNGSERAFLRALSDLGAQSGHAELEQVPWCLWGHSGGGYWAAEMQMLHPDRIVAVWLRSGASALFRDKSDQSASEIPPAVLRVPVVCNPGVKEKDDPRFGRIWDGMLEMFKTFRHQGAPIAFAPDPLTSHECGDSRYLAIPFFDSCLGMRLPERGSSDQKLKPVDMSGGWLGSWSDGKIASASAFEGEAREAVWLPSAAVAQAWSQYIQSGSVSDTTPLPPPSAVRFEKKPDSSVQLSWDAEPDFESGLGGFVIYCAGKETARLPDKPVRRFGRPLFQGMSYHDTPEQPLPVMRWTDTNSANARASASDYQVLAVNGVGLESEKVTAIASAELSGVAARSKVHPVRVLVVYFSRTGNTEQMARAVGEGAKRVGGAEVTVRKLSDVSKPDLEAADGLVLGCPTYFANIPGEMKSVLDDWNWKWKVDFTGKVGGAFATAGGQVGGQEHVVISLLLFMLNNRMVVAGPLYGNEKTGSVWAEAGAAAITGPLDPGVSEKELDGARRLGERVAQVAVRMRY